LSAKVVQRVRCNFGQRGIQPVDRLTHRVAGPEASRNRRGTQFVEMIEFLRSDRLGDRREVLHLNHRVVSTAYEDVAQVIGSASCVVCDLHDDIVLLRTHFEACDVAAAQHRFERAPDTIDTCADGGDFLTIYVDPELWLVELEVRELLSSYDFPGDDIPVVTGSALQALECGCGKEECAKCKPILDLVNETDSYIPVPQREIDKPYLMPVEDVFSISGRGTVVTGRVERGIVKVGEEVEIVGIRETAKTVATGVEMFQKLLDQGQAGDNIGVLLRGVKKEEVERGQVLAKPGSIMPHTKFKAEAYVLTKEEGGRHTPFFKGYRPQFYFRTTDVTGVVTLPEGVEMVMPGDNIAMEVELIMPIAMEKELRFAIREGGRTVGAGVISDIIE